LPGWLSGQSALCAKLGDIERVATSDKRTVLLFSTALFEAEDLEETLLHPTCSGEFLFTCC
jgi:hypothetical protein